MKRFYPLSLFAFISALSVVGCDKIDSDSSDSTTTASGQTSGSNADTGTPSQSSAATSTPGVEPTTDPSGAGGVEVRLIDNVDEPRGYCLDISGGKGEGASIDKGLQAHTCYDYTGGILVDQSFDLAGISTGEFRIPHFNVCMTASSLETGATLQLAGCERKETQLFTLASDGKLVLQAKTDLCVTVSSTEKKEGKGGSPKHVMRPISLQPCSQELAVYQAWQTYSLK